MWKVLHERFFGYKCLQNPTSGVLGSSEGFIESPQLLRAYGARHLFKQSPMRGLFKNKNMPRVKRLYILHANFHAWGNTIFYMLALAWGSIFLHAGSTHGAILYFTCWP